MPEYELHGSCMGAPCPTHCTMHDIYMKSKNIIHKNIINEKAINFNVSSSPIDIIKLVNQPVQCLSRNSSVYLRRHTLNGLCVVHVCQTAIRRSFI